MAIKVIIHKIVPNRTDVSKPDPEEVWVGDGRALISISENGDRITSMRWVIVHFDENDKIIKKRFKNTIGHLIEIYRNNYKKDIIVHVGNVLYPDVMDDDDEGDLI